jgi:hypothetical protein
MVAMSSNAGINRPLAALIGLGYGLLVAVIVLREVQRQRARLAQQRPKGLAGRFGRA